MDSIFLLDRETVDAYTSSTGQPFYSAYPTAYAKSQGYTYDDIDFLWWLRDGYGSTTMYYVNDGYTCNGYQVGHGSILQTNYSFVGVRPAIRVNLSSSLIKRSFQIDVERSTSGAPTISWPSQGASATYRVYRCDELKRDQTLDSDWTLMATLAQNTLSYTDTTARPGYGYYYRVVVTQWNIVNKSNMILYRYKLEKPRLVYAGSDETTGYPKLCWMPVNAVLHYDIERYNEDKDEWENVWRIEPEGYDMVEYIDKKATLGKQYTYRVQACPPTFERFRSDYTDEATIKCVPEKPTGLSVKITSAGMIQLAWNAVKADGYRVLYRDITDGYSTSNQWYSSYVYAGGCILSKAQPGRNYEILVAAAMSQNDNTYDSARVSVTQRCPSLPEFTVQPKNIIAFEDTNPIHVDVKVSASGTGITYKWYTFRPVVDSGSFTMEYTCTDGKYGFDLTREESEMQFYVQAVDQYGRSTYSDTAKVAYISQPKGVTANVGNEAQFTVTTDFPEFIASYQWQSRKDSSSAWSNSGLPGAKTATLTVNAVSGLNGWQFRCVVTDGNGMKWGSNPATLTVK